MTNPYSLQVAGINPHKPGWFWAPNDSPAAADIGGPVAKGIQTCHQLAARRRTHRRNVKVRQANAVAREAVNVGRRGDRVAMA